MRLATIYLRKERLYIQSKSETLVGFWVANDHVQALDAKQAEHIGPLLQSAFEASHKGIPAPPVTEDLTRPMLALAKVKSWRAFAKSAKCVGATLTGREVTLTPYRQTSYAGGFEPMSDKARKLAIDGEDLGTALKSALADAE
jgi:hypothetical protein